jgi:tetratricopeptide (TPR) repeat protein
MMRSSGTSPLRSTAARRRTLRVRDGPEAGLAHMEAVLEHGEPANYCLAHSARADMYRRLGRTAEARSSYEKALALTQQEPERQFLQERIRELNKNLDDLSNSGAAVQLYGEGRATGSPESVSGAICYAKSSQIACRFPATLFDA